MNKYSSASLAPQNVSLSNSSDTSQTANQQAKNWKLIFTPPLAQAMRELKIRHPGEATVFINQLAFWMQTNCGQTTKDGRKWIYNSYENWTKTQFTSLSVSQFGKMIRDLETLKIIEKGNYASLRSYLINKLPGAWHPDQTQSWITLNLERLIELTGYNPFDESWKPLSSTEILNGTTGDSNQNKAEFRSQLPTTYIENYISTQKEKFEKERVENTDRENIEFDQWLDFDPWSDEPPIDTHYVENLEEKPLIDHTGSFEGKYSAALPDFENLVTEPKYNSMPGVGFKKKSDSPPKVKDQVQQVWEIALKRPYPVFLNWWADKKYKPQGGKWEAAAQSNAYSEFYKDCDRTTVAIFPEFLEYMQQVAQNCNQQVASGIKAILPSCFVTMPEANQENVRQVMINIQELVDKGAQVALPSNSVTPACTQSMSFDGAANAGIIQPLQEFITIAASVSELEISADEELLRVLQIKQTSWRNAPALRDRIKRWVEKTDGVVMGENGPELQLEE
ncbi:hypothetical protein [Nostoc sp.]|uniref:hypothetical protein n=1 Tax=Nostoc sp. TaxID=1180 RepID=UPI002FFB00C7